MISTSLAISSLLRQTLIRRYRHVKALESRSQLLDAALASADEANRRWEECRALVDQLRVENANLRAALSNTAAAAQAQAQAHQVQLQQAAQSISHMVGPPPPNLASAPLPNPPLPSPGAQKETAIEGAKTDVDAAVTGPTFPPPPPPANTTEPDEDTKKTESTKESS